MKGLNGKVALITGGASGVGAGLSRRFSQEGVKVVVADILEPEGARLQQEIGSGLLFVKCDLRNDEQIDHLLSETERTFGGLDFLVNAACSYAENGLKSSREQWHTIFDINVFGHALLIQKSVRLLKASNSPAIVNFSSNSGRLAQMGRWVYPATKAATEQMTRSAALELAEHKIRVNALLPGVIGKQDHEYASAESAKKIADVARRSNILSRLQDPDEVAEAVLFLCSAHSQFMTGTTLVADGGCTTLGPLGKEKHVPRRTPAQ